MGPAIASAMVMAAVTVLVPDAYVSASPSNTTEGDKPMNVTVDVAPTKPHAGPTLAASLSPLMRTAGESGWTMARLQGVMGHAFQFKMIKGGGGVMHDNLDWGHAVRIIPELGQFRAFDANKNNPVDDLPSYKPKFPTG